MKRMFIVVLFVSFVSTAFAFYNPGLGRWTSRDPVGEPGFEAIRNKPPSVRAGGPNLYLFVHNEPINRFDLLGLQGSRRCKKPCKKDPNFNYDDSLYDVTGTEGGLGGYISELSDRLNNAETPPGATPDKWRHCMFTCLTVRNDRPLEAIGAALLSEIPIIRGGHTSWADFGANLSGLETSLSRKSCSEACACVAQGMPYD